MPGAASTSGRCVDCGTPWSEATAHCFHCGRPRVSASCARHRDRVARRACLICGEAMCRRCRCGRRHAPACAAHEHVAIIQGWAEVARVRDEVRASLLADRLRAADVEATVFSQKDSAQVVTFGGLSVVRVLVPAHRYEEAVARLAEGESGPGAAR